jgi:hypothetical protein
MRWRSLFLTLGGLVLAGRGALYALESRYIEEQLRGAIARAVSKALSADTEIASVEVNALDRRIRLDNISAAVRGYSPFFTLSRAEIVVDPVPLLWGTLALETVSLEHPVLRLTREKKIGSNLPAPSSQAPSKGGIAIELGSLQVQDGAFQVILPGAVFAELRGISAHVHRQPDDSYHASLRAEGGSLDLPRLHEPISRLSFSGVYQQGNLHIQRAALSSKHFSFSLDEPQPERDPRQPDQTREVNPGRLSFPLPVIGRALAWPDLQGEISATLALSLSFDESGPRLGAALAARGVALGSLVLGDASLDLALSAKEFAVTKATLRAGDGTINASASLGLSQDLPLAIHAQGKRLRLEQVLAQLGVPGSWVSTTFDGEATLSGQLAHGFTLKGDLSMNGDSLSVLTRSYLLPREGAPYLEIPAYQNRVSVEVLSNQVKLSAGRLALPHTALDYEGWISFDQRIDLSARGPVDFDELGAITGVRYQGAGEMLRGKISGWLDDPAMSADLRLRGFGIEGYPLGEISGGLRYEWPTLSFVGLSGNYQNTLYRAQGDLDLAKSSLPITMRATIEQGRPRPLAEMMLLGDYLPEGIDAQLQGNVSVRGPIESPKISAQATFRNLDLFGEKISGGEAEVQYQPYGDFEILSSSFQDGTGSLSLTGTMSDAGDLAFLLSGETLDTARLDLVDLRAAKVSAQYGLSAALSGTLDAPRLDSQLRIGTTKIGGLRFPGSVLSLGLTNNELSLSGSVLERAKVSGKVTLQGALPYQLEVETEPLALDLLFPWLAGTQARAGGALSLSGDLTAPSQSQGALRLSSVSADYFGIGLRALGTLDISLQNETLTLSPARLSLGDGAVTLHAAASYPFGDVLGIDFATSTDLAALRELPQLAPWIPAELTALTGDISITGSAEFQPKGVSLLAAASLRGFSLSLDGIPQPVENVDLDLTITQDNIFLDRLSGTFADGALKGSGELSLSRWMPERLRLETTLERAEIRRPDDGFSASASADLTLEGTLSALRLSGEVLIDNLRYDQEVEVLPSLQELLAGKRSFVSLPPAEETPATSSDSGPSLALDVEVKSPGPMEIENNLVRAEFQIDEQRPFRIQGDSGHPTPRGSITLVSREDRPAYVKLRDTELQLTRGRLDFEDSFDPAIDLLAEARVRDFDISARASGTLSVPRLVVTSNPALSEPDIILLVALGVTQKEFAELDSAKSLSLLAPTLLSEIVGVREEVDRILPNSINLNLTSGFSERDNAFVPKLQWTWDPTQDLRIRLTSNVLSLRDDNQAEIQWRLGDKLSFSGSWDQQGGSTLRGLSIGDIGVDLRWRREFARWRLWQEAAPTSAPATSAP